MMAEAQLTRTIRLQVQGGNVVVQEIRTMATQAEARLQQMGSKAEDEMRRLGRVTRNAVGGIALQLQDVAVQLQSGQNPLIILTQQGSQIASVFGPGGIIAGALLALGGLMAQFAFGVSKAAEEAEALVEQFDKLMRMAPRSAEEIEKLAEQIGRLTTTERAAQVLAAERDLDTIQEKARAIAGEIARAAAAAVEPINAVREALTEAPIPQQDLLGPFQRLLEDPRGEVQQQAAELGRLLREERAVMPITPEVASEIGRIDQLLAAVQRAATLDTSGLEGLRALLEVEPNPRIREALEKFADSVVKAVASLGELRRRENELLERRALLKGRTPTAERPDERRTKEEARLADVLQRQFNQAQRERLQALFDVLEATNRLGAVERAQLEAAIELQQRGIALSSAKAQAVLQEAAAAARLKEILSDIKDEEKIAGFLGKLQGRVDLAERRAGEQRGEPLSREREIAAEFAASMADLQALVGPAASAVEDRVRRLVERLVDARRQVEAAKADEQIQTEKNRLLAEELELDTRIRVNAGLLSEEERASLLDRLEMQRRGLDLGDERVQQLLELRRQIRLLGAEEKGQAQEKAADDFLADVRRRTEELERRAADKKGRPSFQQEVDTEFARVMEEAVRAAGPAADGLALKLRELIERQVAATRAADDLTEANKRQADATERQARVTELQISILEKSGAINEATAVVLRTLTDLRQRNIAIGSQEGQATLANALITFALTKRIEELNKAKENAALVTDAKRRREEEELAFERRIGAITEAQLQRRRTELELKARGIDLSSDLARALLQEADALARLNEEIEAAAREEEAEDAVVALRRRVEEERRKLAVKSGAMTEAQALIAREDAKLRELGLTPDDYLGGQAGELINELARLQEAMEAIDRQKEVGKAVDAAVQRRLEAEMALQVAQGTLTEAEVARRKALLDLKEKDIAATSEAGRRILAEAAATEAARAALERLNKEKDRQKELDALVEKRIQAEEKVAVLLGVRTEREVALAEARRKLAADEIDPDSPLGRRMLDEEERIAALVERQKELIEQHKRAEQIAEGVGTGIAKGFERAIFAAENLQEVIVNLGEEMLKLILRVAILEPLARSIAGGIQGFLQPAAALAMRGSTPPIGTYAPDAQARGGVWEAGRMLAYASGGIVERATMFPIRGGRVGLMGEAGPEAILPLRRGPGGRLGVEAATSAPVLQVRVETIDQRQHGAPVQTEVQRQGDGSVVVRQLIRDLMQGAIAQGQLDTAMAQRFNLRPAAR